jgi:hypothetical protein
MSMTKAKSVTTSQLTRRTAPSVAASADWTGICHRLEKIVDILRTSFVCDGWQFDEEAAERSLAYVRALASGAPEMKPAWKR